MPRGAPGSITARSPGGIFNPQLYASTAGGDNAGRDCTHMAQGERPAYLSCTGLDSQPASPSFGGRAQQQHLELLDPAVAARPAAAGRIQVRQRAMSHNGSTVESPASTLQSPQHAQQGEALRRSLTVTRRRTPLQSWNGCVHAAGVDPSAVRLESVLAAFAGPTRTSGNGYEAALSPTYTPPELAADEEASATAAPEPAGAGREQQEASSPHERTTWPSLGTLPRRLSRDARETKVHSEPPASPASITALAAKPPELRIDGDTAMCPAELLLTIPPHVQLHAPPSPSCSATAAEGCPPRAALSIMTASVSSACCSPQSSPQSGRAASSLFASGRGSPQATPTNSPYAARVMSQAFAEMMQTSASLPGCNDDGDSAAAAAGVSCRSPPAGGAELPASAKPLQRSSIGHRSLPKDVIPSVQQMQELQAGFGSAKSPRPAAAGGLFGNIRSRLSSAGRVPAVQPADANAADAAASDQT